MKWLLYPCVLLWPILTRADDWPHATDTQKAGEHPPSPLEQVGMMTVPEGFKVTLFAGEPEVRQPVAFTFDERGRLWVLECYTYTGKQEFDEGKRDRIVILEDKDGDGRFDERKVFWEEGVRAFGLERGLGGVWVLQAPYLSFIPDRDCDDVPDGPAEHKLDGFSVAAGHNTANGLRWGPDGWLWGRHGMLDASKADAVGTPAEERKEFKACLWRFDTFTNKFEVVCEGGVNPWGFDWNEVGEMFFTNNVNGHLFHAIPGARYRENFVPPHHADRQPFLSMCADHQHWEYGKVWHEARAGGTTDELGGGHSHCGGMIYLGDNWPAEYRGRVFLHNTHGKRVNQEILERKGSGYIAKHGEDFLKANSEWYRGVELSYGPDGGVYMLDWSDSGECHDHDGVHRGSGRIYKVCYGVPEKNVEFNLREFTDLELVELQLFENDWWVRQARRILQERSLENVLDRAEVREELLRIYGHPAVSRRLRAMWCLYSAGLVGDDWLQVQLRDENEHIRVWALRLLADHGLGYGRVRLIFGRMAKSDPSALVRLHLASVMQKIPIGHRLEVLLPIAQHQEDVDDANLPLMIWFAAEESIARLPGLAIELACTTPHRITRRLVARKIAADRESQPETLNGLIAALGEVTDPEVQSDVLEGMLEALHGVREAVAPASWAGTYPVLAASASGERATLLAELAVVFSDAKALDDFRRLAADAAGSVTGRRRALEVLVRAGAEGIEGLLTDALEVKGLAIPAMQGLAATRGVDAAARILARYPTMEPEEARVAISVLSSRPEFAPILLDAVASGAVRAADLTAFDARQIQALGDAALSNRLETLWGSLRAARADKNQEIERVRAVVAASGIGGGDPARGRVHFSQRCAACHTLWGEGGQVGPDLTGTDRRNLDYLLENILDPSASVPQNYRLTLVELKDGQSLSGFVEEEVGGSIRLRAQDQVYHLPREMIRKRDDKPTSLMPDGLLIGLGDEEVRDLFSYLRGSGQVALP